MLRIENTKIVIKINLIQNKKIGNYESKKKKVYIKNGLMDSSSE